MSAFVDLGHDPHVWVVPEYKLAYVSTPKNACSTLKRVVATVAGEDLSSFRAGLKPYVNDAYAVHNRALYRRVRYLDELDPSTAGSIHPDNGWLVFGVARDPRSRLFSAWQDKFLLRSPGFFDLRDEPWFPAFPDTAEQVVEDFAQFVDVLTSSPSPALVNDGHFRSQVSILRPQTVPFSTVYSIGSMARLESDLTEHVRRLGWQGDLDFEPENSTPLRPTAALFAGDTAEKIEKFYAEDFSHFGDLWPQAARVTEAGWGSGQLSEARARAVSGERISQVRDIALAERRKRIKTEQRLELEQRRAAGQAARIERLRARVEAAEGKARRAVVAERQTRAKLPSVRLRRAVRRGVARFRTPAD